MSTIDKFDRLETSLFNAMARAEIDDIDFMVDTVFDYMGRGEKEGWLNAIATDIESKYFYPVWNGETFEYRQPKNYAESEKAYTAFIERRGNRTRQNKLNAYRLARACFNLSNRYYSASLVSFDFGRNLQTAKSYRELFIATCRQAGIDPKRVRHHIQKLNRARHYA